jgi:late competence protein required for DNA uptake (superfamily II DNA/RNA helicase)
MIMKLINIMYECGRCGQLVRKEYKVEPNDVIALAPMYCGKCISKNRASLVSAIITDVKEIADGSNKPDTGTSKTKNVQV